MRTAFELQAAGLREECALRSKEGALWGKALSSVRQNIVYSAEEF